MICSYCGASYRKNAERCPNCQSENVLMIEKRKNKVRKAIDDQALEAVKDLPQKKVKRVHMIVVIAIVGVLVALLVGGTLGYALTKYKAKIEYATYQHNVEKMEELIAKEKWEEFFDYYYNHDCWDSKYDKYEQLVHVRTDVEDVYYYVTRYFQVLEDYEREGAKSYKDTASDCLQWAFENYATLCEKNKKYVNDRAILGNEIFLKLWEEEIVLYLKENLQITDEELDVLRESQENDGYRALIHKYIERDMK